MAQLGADPVQDREFWHGVLNGLRWALFVGFGLLGLLAAAQAVDTLDYIRDLGIFVAVVLLLLWEVKRYFDGAPPPTLQDLVFDDLRALAIGLPALLLLGLAGLFLASRAATRDGYYAGLGLAVGAAGMAFLSLKASFDAAETGGPDY